MKCLTLNGLYANFCMGKEENKKMHTRVYLWLHKETLKGHMGLTKMITSWELIGLGDRQSHK